MAQLIAGCSRLAASVEDAPARAREWLRTWAREVQGGTRFGTQSLACLEGNWPRGIDIALLDAFIDRLAGRG